MHVYPVIVLPTSFKGVLFGHLKRAGAVEVRGLGVFTIVKIKGRVMYHNFSGKEKKFAGYKKLKFIQSRELKEQLS